MNDVKRQRSKQGNAIRDVGSFKLEGRSSILAIANSGNLRDKYVAAKSRLASLRSKLRDDTNVAKHLSIVEKQRAAGVSDAISDRKSAALAVTSQEATLKKAESLAKDARHYQRLARNERSSSETAEAQGLALQKPAAALLKDSQKLNDQSNLVLDQSHSSQAKALASLDLKLAQSLADRAAKGMARAKQDFASAIDDRKTALKDDEVASNRVMEAAKVSLQTNPEQSSLLRIQQGQLTGSKALQSILNIDTNSVGAAQEKLGESRKQVKLAKESEGDVARQILVLDKEAKALRAEIGAAEKEVLAAAKEHLLAARKYKSATLKSISAQSKIEAMREDEVRKLRSELASTKQSKEDAGQRYTRALQKIAKLNGHQTIMKVQIARLKLQLKEEEMRAHDYKAKNSKDQEVINNMQAQLDREDADLNEAKLKIADSSLGLAGGRGASRRSSRGREDDYHSRAQATIEAAKRAGSHHSYRNTLDLQRRRDDELSREEQAARRRAEREERKLKEAQSEVSRQLAKVTDVESNF
ncbi:hypothetical protein GUITHDRAFT_105538 [Guillardia theta CCMP2712]|uniref:Uncharacterized protein n=1 Tax=Guillardia theta (strain CCMP2712) TaxID=905079 RepID=L1JKS0_GUITC|nr:hypothetical protein GUITHDRAFT_105538 [Guillardia theta CCMP2712]EKX48912.1 hypothetical protein GUITHDRAFT_105538 [Guillardia theta CCMP2712]|eukprot:XP_005835892.1 hypothetical protein GUITHDRAFT_105538 [Guillardia theta CCMP2712]